MNNIIHNGSVQSNSKIIISYKYHINIIIIWCGTRTRQRQSLGMKARSQSERGRLPATHLVIKCYCPNYSHDYLIIMIVLMTNLPRRTVRTTLTGTMGNASTATVDRGTPACNIIISYEEIVSNKGFWKYKLWTFQNEPQQVSNIIIWRNGFQ